MPPRRVPPAVQMALKKRIATSVAASANASASANATSSSASAPRKRKASAMTAAGKTEGSKPSSSSSTSKKTISEPKRDHAGRLLFPDFPEFRPRLSPAQMIRRGVFGGIYFNPRGGKPGILHPRGVDIDHREFPSSWFEGVEESFYLSRRYNAQTNFFRVKAGQDQVFWEQKGWIDARDQRGWFHWYCRFFCGRRIDDDARQVSRWNGVAGAKGRWRRALANKCAARGLPASRAGEASPVIAQTLLHWADELTEADVAAAVKRMKSG